MNGSNKSKLVLLTIFFIMMSDVVFAQSSVNSPYTRYGYGLLSDKATTAQRGMGGIGYGVRNPQFINTVNPASFSALDSLTFMFDLGVMGQSAWFKDGLNTERKNNANIEYLAMQFLLGRRLGFGVGLEPVSFVGYSYGDTTRLAEDDMLNNTSQGTGGLSQVYGTLSYDFFNKVSLGVKLSYLYGDIAHSNQVSFTSATLTNPYNIYWNDTLRASGLTYEFGLQYHQPIGKYKMLTIGGIYSPLTRFGGKIMQATMRTDPSTGTVMSNEYYVTRDSVFELPASYGLGFTYNEYNKLTLGADVLYQNWSGAKYYDQTDAFNNRLKVTLGGELIPNATSNKFLNRVRYRAGLYYANSYLKVEDSGYKEYGISIGLGIPTTTVYERTSYVNFAFNYSLVRPDVKTLIKEQYIKLTLSYTFNESWFFKRKVQ
jgi:hypothetical protein